MRTCLALTCTSTRRALSEGDGTEPDKERIDPSLRNEHGTRYGPSTAQQRRFYQRRVTISPPESGPHRGIRVKRTDPRREHGQRSHFETHQLDVERDIWATDPAVDSWQLGFLLIHLMTGKNWFKEEMMQKPKASNNWHGALDENEDDFDLRAVEKLHECVMKSPAAADDAGTSWARSGQSRPTALTTTAGPWPLISSRVS